MKTIDRIVYNGILPESFFKIPQKIYQDTSIKPSETPDVIQTLFSMEAGQHEIIIYTDHQNLRLTGIFPKNEDIAYFGFWESINDQGLHAYAFGLLEVDAREKGRSSLIGPINFGTYHANRLRIGETPIWGMFDKEPVNPAYYPDLLTGINFKEKLTYESRLVSRANLPTLFANKSDFVKAISQIPFDFIPLTMDNWEIYEKDIYELLHAIFSENPFYKAISFEQFRLIYDHQFASKLCPHSSVLFKDQASGQLACISMCSPNYQSLYPAITSPNFARDFEKLEHKTLLAKTIGVHPDFRRQGLLNYIGAYGLLPLQNRIYDDVLLCLMRSNNYSTHFSNHVPYEAAKYALYEKSLV